MKICEYIPTASFFVGGGEIYPLLQTKYLAGGGYNVTLVVLKTKNQSEYFKKYKEDNPNIEIFELESPIENAYSFSNRELNHDVAHELYFSLGRAFSEHCSNNNYDLIITHYGPGAVSCPQNIKQILFLHGVPSAVQPVNVAAVAVSDKLIAVSKSVAQGWKKMFKIKENIDLVYNAVDINLYFPINIKKDIDILYLGRLIEIKGVQHLINALKILRDKGYSLELTIAGKGPYEEQLKKLATKLGINNRINFLGYVPEERKLELYNRSKICVFPSYAKEGVLTTMLEAASTAAPIITANCCGMVDFIKNGKNGLLFEPKNVDDLANKILLLTNNPEISRKIGSNARKSVEKEWNWQYHIKKLERVINSMQECI